MTKQIMVGGVAVGGGAPVTIQSMCNTKTEDAGATIEQILRLEQAGCEIVRVAVPDMAAADAVLELASALPEGDALTLDAEGAIVAARKAYDELTEDQKHLIVSEAALQMIEAAEQGLQAAKDAEAARIAAEEAAAEETYYEEDYSYDD